MTVTAPKSATHVPFNFHDELIAILPRLKASAIALTRHRAEAEDLLQTAVANALAHRESFEPGTNFNAWMHSILRNRFLSDRRAKRNLVEFDDVSQTELARPASQEESYAVGELRRHMARLSGDQREALMMIVLEGKSYDEVAEITGAAVGTVKCRVFRARKQLETWLLGEGEGRRSGPRHARRQIADRINASQRAM